MTTDTTEPTDEIGRDPAPAAPSPADVAGEPFAPTVIRVDRLMLVAAGFAVALVAVSLANTFVDVVLDRGSVEFVNIDQEGNLPTWFQSGLLAASGLVALAIAAAVRRSGGRWLWHWLGLAVLMTWVSIDEASQVHELLIDPVRDALHTDGILYWGWVIPGFAVVVVLGFAYLGFIRAQAPNLRRGLFLAAALYVSGALVMEAVSGTIDSKTLYKLSTTLEETLELAGQLVLLWTLLRAWAPGGRLVITPDR